MNISLTDIGTYGIGILIIMALVALVGMFKIYTIMKQFRDDIVTDISKELKNTIIPQLTHLKEDVDSLKSKADNHVSCELCEVRTNYRKEEIKNINDKIDKNTVDIAQLQGMLQQSA
jgi:peptidoglycan hydrolase CwlO-like protein